MIRPDARRPPAPPARPRAVPTRGRHGGQRPGLRGVLPARPAGGVPARQAGRPADGGDVCRDYERQFREPLTERDLAEFVELARTQGLLGEARPVPARPSDPAKQSLLHWRKPLLDPDRLFDRLLPWLGAVWTRSFAVSALLFVAAGGLVFWSHAGEFAAAVAAAARLDNLLLTWAAVAAVTTAHEFAHGLTCKRFGGKVHEVGFLLMFLMPCFYCNVSDAWLLPSRWKRVAVSAAGMACDLVLWAGGVFVWRVTLPGSLPNDLAVIVASVCGVRTILNANPFMKLDGYYILSDLVETPNLIPKAQGHLHGTARWLLWGAARPAAERHGRLLAVYGLATLVLPLGFLLALTTGLAGHLTDAAGPAGTAVAAVAGGLLLAAPLGGLAGGEVRRVALTRRRRTVGWLAGLGTVAATLTLWHWKDRAHGPFELRAADRADLRAKVAGFLREVAADEGTAVAKGQVVARLEVPHLDSKLAQKQAERREGAARLKLLLVGPRPEEVAAQRERVGRGREWAALARADLQKVRQATAADLAKLDDQVGECRAEAAFCRASLGRAAPLWKNGVMSREEYETYVKKNEVAGARLAQAESARQARSERGVIDADNELARREKALAED